MPNYLVLMKSQRTEKPVAGNRPSPEQMQQMFAAYKVWMTQFKRQHREHGRQAAAPAVAC
jgi:hypothetical protein